MLVVGIDPDSKKHGVAWVCNGKIVDLMSMTTAALVQRLSMEATQHQLLIKLEDINAFKPVIQRPGQNRNQMLRIAQNIGAAKLAAVQVYEALTEAGLIVNMVNPLVKAMSGKAYKAPQFNRYTGWVGTSNADTRDAAMIALNGKAKGRGQFEYCGVQPCSS
ncbi:hypothetical protein [Rheinheimera sp. MM224]|uniref:hypothetical protein n=1 Tax=Rheinheimera sp. MM224 TaxID=3019969 RepID=UPI0021F91773|nr:hypothetical protein [Rheinheimera sp. MM224]CAI3795787.1 hypothetical protein JAMGFMIE_01405 [Rheinheimera sp. MM224]CAI3795948.1 hypothetical protein JAMGFMIE_01445 [Rheinheimera sp. MM224]